MKKDPCRVVLVGNSPEMRVFIQALHQKSDNFANVFGKNFFRATIDNVTYEIGSLQNRPQEGFHLDNAEYWENIKAIITFDPLSNEKNLLVEHIAKNYISCRIIPYKNEIAAIECLKSIAKPPARVGFFKHFPFGIAGNDGRLQALDNHP
jgi:hypothetical protein